jgi:hypothetical protein
MRAVMRCIALVVAVAACGGGSSPGTPDGDPSMTADAAPGVDGATGCPRVASPADGPRHVVVSHPYDAAGDPSPAYEVIDLSATGELSRPGRTFTLGRATVGSIAFTPDGEVGLVAQEDGTVGVFRLVDGVPEVVHAAFDGGFYASRVVIDPRGDRALVLDEQWRENGGGIYAVTIGCDGTLSAAGMVAPAKLAGAIAFRGDRAIVAARDIASSMTTGHDVHLLAWNEPPSPLAGTDAFADDEQILGGAALTRDGSAFLVGDVSGFSGVPNRVAVVGVGTDDTIRLIDVVTPVEDPEAIATSPHGNVAVVTSAFGDAIFVLDDGGPMGHWRMRGEVAYSGAAPQLPGDLAAIARGSLDGHVLVSELSSIRHLVFRNTGAVDDLGSLAFGDGLDNIAGAIGVTP